MRPLSQSKLTGVSFDGWMRGCALKSAAVFVLRRKGSSITIPAPKLKFKTLHSISELIFSPFRIKAEPSSFMARSWINSVFRLSFSFSISVILALFLIGTPLYRFSSQSSLSFAAFSSQKISPKTKVFAPSKLIVFVWICSSCPAFSITISSSSPKSSLKREIAASSVFSKRGSFSLKFFLKSKIEFFSIYFASFSSLFKQVFRPSSTLFALVP